MKSLHQVIAPHSRRAPTASHIPSSLILHPSPRRGSAYLAVLAVTVIVATMGLGALLAIRAQARSAAALADAAEARQYALNAIELGRLWIRKDAQWRTNRTSGAWITQQAFGDGTFSLEVTDPVDGNLANRPHDPVVFKATGIKGQARQMIQVTLSANPVPLPALQYALHTGGELHVKSAKTLTATSATVSTNGALKNEGTVAGNVEAASASQTGTVTGSLILGAATKTFPDSSVRDLYANLGTLIAPGNTIEKQVLSPGRNPWGTTNPDGVYVIRTNSDLTIKNTRIYGTLVVICPGNTVTFTGAVLIQPVRTDYPTLIVHGNANFLYSSDGATLSEPTTGVNFNPSDTPYEDQSDADTADVYPSEIQGLVHVTGTTTIKNTALIRGLLLCESSLSSDAVVSEDCQIVYDSSLYSSPPQGYTTEVKMIPQSGSWKQMVD